MHMCGKCGKLFAFLIVLAGVLFLLQDLAVWSFWNLSWYTVVFILFGLAHFCMGYCPECCETKKKK